MQPLISPFRPLLFRQCSRFQTALEPSQSSSVGSTRRRFAGFPGGSPEWIASIGNEAQMCVCSIRNSDLFGGTGAEDVNLNLGCS